MSEVLDVYSLGTLQPQDFVVEKAVSGLQLLVDRVETLEVRGLRTQLGQEPVHTVGADLRIPL